MICIYKITSPSGKIYIGQTIRYSIRMNSYKNLQCKNQPALYNSFLTYGFLNHNIEIIEQVEKEILDEREIYWIDFYKCNKCKYTKGLGLNLSDGGGSPKGYKQSSESILKRLSKTIGLKRSEEVKKLLSKLATGRKHNEKTILKISLNNKQSKKVIDDNTLIIYDSVAHASKELDINVSTLRHYLKGRIYNKTSLRFL